LKPFFVYMLRCSDGSYYVGHTDELEHRFAQHQAGEIEGYTHERRPVELVWSQETASREEALAAERRIKGWGRVKKEALIRGDWLKIAQHAWGTRNPMPDRLQASIPQPERRLAETRFNPPSAVRPEVSKGSSRSANEGARDGASIPQPERVSAKTPFVQPPTVHPEVSRDPLLLRGVLNRERRALAKAITLLESTRADHRERADGLLNTLLPHTGQAMRLGISGVPGVGKSTFIEALGLSLIAKGHRVAVLAIDPSSSVSGGSILGDKTRMERLSVSESAYIRPSPASGTLGGVAEKTREAMLVCEAAGYDVVIVETVGVGQSETAVASMTDMFVLLQLPNAGDDLQAIKKGVMELADLVVINKADIDPAAATRAQAQIASALRMFSHHERGSDRWHTQVMQLSALKGQGIDEFWAQVEQFHRQRRASGEFDARRKQQALAWMWDLIHARLHADFRLHPAVREALAHTLRDVSSARIAPSAAARLLLSRFERT
jgi:LAO/AO transport system kinase